MLKNYLKVALKVLGRNKLYTFISLFGISFTLAVLMLATSFIDKEMGKNAPLSKLDRITYIPSLKMERWNVEEITTYDSTYVDDHLIIDTLVTEKKLVGDSESDTNSGISDKFFFDHLNNLKHVEYASVFNPNATLELFQNSKKIPLSLNYCDANYFRIFDFQFTEGGPFTQQAVDNQSKVIILSESSAKEYFGKLPNFLGRMVDYDNEQFEVVGVFKDVTTSIGLVSVDALMPYTHMAPALRNYEWGFFGDMEAAFLLPAKSDLEGFYEEIIQKENTIDITTAIDLEDFDKVTIRDIQILEGYAMNLIQGYERKDNFKILKWILGLGLAFFVLIPTINLINLNITRIMERSAEIGVRKSFGAKTSDLMVQFLFENIVITLIGGVIGFILTVGLMNLLNTSGLLGKTQVTVNPKLFLLSLGITLLFGIVSGLLPAYKMSKTTIAKAIKTNAI